MTFQFFSLQIEDDEVVGVRGFGGLPDRVIELKQERRKSRAFRSRSFSGGESLHKCIHESDEKVNISFSESVVV